MQERNDHALRQPELPGADGTQGEHTQLESEAMKAGTLKQEQLSLPQQAADAPAAEFAAHSTEPALPFHPEQSLQEAQHAADEKMMHDANGETGSMPDMPAEPPKQEMTEAPQVPEGGTQSGEPGARHQHSAGQGIRGLQTMPQQMEQTQPAAAVRTLDDIMSQFEGLPQPPTQSFSAPNARQEPPAGASRSPMQAQAHQESAGGNDMQAHAAHAAQDQDMPDAMEAGTPQQPVAEMPNGTLLQGKVQATSCLVAASAITEV